MTVLKLVFILMGSACCSAALIGSPEQLQSSCRIEWLEKRFGENTARLYVGLIGAGSIVFAWLVL